MASPSTRRDRRSAAAPLVVEVVRGAMVESRHQASVAIVDPDGAVAAAWGDIDEPVYPRSALKPLQALPLVESGAAAAHGLDQPALAVATASHTGEPRHVEVVGRWLAGVGLGSGDLECGAHAPTNAAAAEALLRAGAAPTALHNNCSGKHTGILTTARHLDLPTAGYTAFDHPVQQLLRDTVGAVTGVDLGQRTARHRRLLAADLWHAVAQSGLGGWPGSPPRHSWPARGPRPPPRSMRR